MFLYIYTFQNGIAHLVFVEFWRNFSSCNKMYIVFVVFQAFNLSTLCQMISIDSLTQSQNELSIIWIGTHEFGEQFPSWRTHSFLLIYQVWLNMRNFLCYRNTLPFNVFIFSFFNICRSNVYHSVKFVSSKRHYSVE